MSRFFHPLRREPELFDWSTVDAKPTRVLFVPMPASGKEVVLKADRLQANFLSGMLNRQGEFGYDPERREWVQRGEFIPAKGTPLGQAKHLLGLELAGAVPGDLLERLPKKCVHVVESSENRVLLIKFLTVEKSELFRHLTRRYNAMIGEYSRGERAQFLLGTVAITGGEVTEEKHYNNFSSTFVCTGMTKLFCDSGLLLRSSVVSRRNHVAEMLELPDGNTVYIVNPFQRSLLGSHVPHSFVTASCKSVPAARTEEATAATGAEGPAASEATVPTPVTLL